MAVVAPDQVELDALEQAYVAAAAAEERALERYGLARRAAERAFSDAAVDPARRDAADGAEIELTLMSKAVTDAQTMTAKALVAWRGGRLDERDGLPAGEFAELQTRPTHDEWKKLVRVTAKLATADLEDKVEVMTEYVLVLLASWNVRDRDGHELPPTADGVATAPQTTLVPVFARAAAIFRTIPNPNL